RRGRGLGKRSFGPLSLRFCQQLRRCGQLDGEMFARQVVEGVRATPRIENEARQHRVISDAGEWHTGTRKRDPRRLDVVPRLADGRIGKEGAQGRKRAACDWWQVARWSRVELAFARLMAEGEIPRAPGRHREREAGESRLRLERDEARGPELPAHR